jgi:hypothetical protein
MSSCSALPAPIPQGHRPLACLTPHFILLKEPADLLNYRDGLQDLVCSWTKVPELAEGTLKSGLALLPRLAQGCDLSGTVKADRTDWDRQDWLWRQY